MNFDITSHAALHAGIGVAVVLVGTSVVWYLLSRSANRAKKHYRLLLDAAQSSPETVGELALVQRRLTALRLVVNTAKYLITVTAIVLVLNQLNVNLDSLILSAGFLGAALGLGAQNVVRDFLAGLFVVFEGQLNVGDIVSINGVQGTIEEVGFRITRLRDAGGGLHFFQNGAVDKVIKLPSQWAPTALLVRLPDEQTHDKACQVVRDEVELFGRQYEWFSRPVEATAESESEPGGWLKLILPVRPTKIDTVAERLPGRVRRALAVEGIEMPADCDIEIAVTTTA